MIEGNDTGTGLRENEKVTESSDKGMSSVAISLIQSDNERLEWQYLPMSDL